MKKKDNKFSSILLAVMMIASLFSMVPAAASADEMKTVYVGFIDNWHQNGVEELTGWQVHYWGSASCEADADLTRMKGSFAKQSVGDSYWSGEEQTFYMYKATVPADATGYKVHNGNTWVGDDGNLSSCNAAYIFDYGGSNHVLYYSYTEDGYFLVGSMNGWSVGNENYRFTPNTNNEGEYVFYNVSLNKDDEFKVVGVKDNMPTWYPEGFNNNYKVSTTGTYNIYFRPDGQGNDDWYYNYFYVEKITDFSVNDAGTEYTIYTATGWNLFCDALLDKDTYNGFSGKTVYLANDIEVSRMAGSQYHDFAGTFDGQNNTLTFNYTTTESTVRVAPFSYITNNTPEGSATTIPAVIRNLNVVSNITTNGEVCGGIVGESWGELTIEHCTVSGTITTSNQYAGGIIGRVSSTPLNMTDCRSSVTINSSVSGDGTHGGIAALVANGNNVALNIEGCVFDGKLLTVNTGETATIKCGGFVGWRNSPLSISNSLYAPNAVEGENWVGNSESATFARNGNTNTTITNCYYATDFNDGTHFTAQGTKAIAVNKGYTEDVNPNYATSGIKLHYGYMECNGIWYAPAGTSLTVGYVDEHGVAQSHAATVLGGSTNTGNNANDLSGDWYVAGGDISYSATVWFKNNAQLILADGGKMNVKVNQNDGLSFSSLTIYGQTAGTGELHASNSSSNSAIGGKKLIVNGGIITAIGRFAIAINSNGNMTVNQGNVTANGMIQLNIKSSLTINGGSLSTPSSSSIKQDGSVIFNGGAFNVGIVKVPNVTLNYTSPDDRFKAIIDITTVTVTVADGKAFTDGTNIYFGILTPGKINAINKLEPYINIGDVNGDGLVTIADASMLVELFRFENDVNVFSNADVNGDGQVTPSDIMAILNMILTP